jgi:hypothetical protein
MSKCVVKRSRPGRPPKDQSSNLVILGGIVARPDKPNHIMELEYENPASLKKVFSMIYSCNKKAIYFTYTKDKVIISCKDHHGKLIIDVTIHGSNAMRYYCKEDFTVSIEALHLDSLSNIIKKNFGKIILYMKENEELPKLYICLHEAQIESNDSKSILTNKATVPMDLLTPLANEYEVSFKLDAAHFKKRLTTYSKDKQDLCKVYYRGDKAKSIKFQYENAGGVLGEKTEYCNDKTIELKAVDGTSEVSASFKLDYFRSIFNTVVAPDFRMYLSKKHGICLRFILDVVPFERLKASVTNDSIIVRVFAEEL